MMSGNVIRAAISVDAAGKDLPHSADGNAVVQRGTFRSCRPLSEAIAGAISACESAWMVHPGNVGLLKIPHI
jgi:hypothetical protein